MILHVIIQSYLQCSLHLSKSISYSKATEKTVQITKLTKIYETRVTYPVNEKKNEKPSALGQNLLSTFPSAASVISGIASYCRPHGASCCLALHLSSLAAPTEVHVNLLNISRNKSAKVKLQKNMQMSIYVNITTWITQMLINDSRQKSPNPMK